MLTPSEQERLRALLSRHGANQVGSEPGVSGAAIRASNVIRVLAGTAALVRGLAELHEAALADESGDKLQEELADVEAAAILNGATAGA